MDECIFFFFLLDELGPPIYEYMVLKEAHACLRNFIEARERKMNLKHAPKIRLENPTSVSSMHREQV